MLVAGRPSHGPGDHEFRAGALLIKACLDKIPGINAVVHSNGWPSKMEGEKRVDDNAAFQGADAIMLFMDGGGGHPAIQGDRLKVLAGLIQKGVGLGCYHYGVEVPKDKGGPEFLQWIGGYYEDRWSTNPHWDADIKSLPRHPITSGVQPFKVKDEWYYNIRFRPEMKGVTPILVATPSDETRQGKTSSPRGPYPHIVAANGREEILAWAVEREDGGRGFGFTGGHAHKNFGNDNFRKLVLNSLVWLAKMEVPADGVPSARPTEEELKKNLDPKGQRRQAEATPPPRPSGLQVALADTKKLTPGTGLEASLFAAEPMVVNPTDMDIDERGRIWITEGANYRLTMHAAWGIIRPGGDRIVILEDTNGDGRADKEKVFYQDPTINSALGICVLGNKAIVSSSPNVFVLTDTDGDSVADKRELLFRDSSRGDHDHCMHAFVFGPDGKLYFNFGNEVRELRRPKGGILSLPLHGPVPEHEFETVVDLAGNEVKANGKPYRQGMAFRCNLDGSEVETVGWNFRNNYELAVDSFGTIWQSDNDDDGNKGVRINYVMEFGNYGFTDELTGAGWGTAWKKAQAKGVSEDEKPAYHWHLSDPGVVPNLLQTGNGSPTGIAIYEGKALPEVFRNQIIHCDAGPRVVRAYPVENSGAGYSARIENILTSADNWYRPSDVAVGPDGALYIADWNDAGVGGHNMADRALTNMTGRVYRVAPPGLKSSVPPLNLKTAAGCVAALQSPNQATRYLAWTELHKMQGKATKELEKLWKQQDEPRMRARALQLLARIDGKEKKYVEAALKDKNADIRIAGLRIARELDLNTISYVKQLAKDPSPQVRRECAIALRHSESSDAPKLWATLAAQHDGQDRWYLEALGIGADRQEEKFFAAWLKQVKGNWDTPAGRDLVWRSRSTQALPMLVKLITAREATAADKDRYMRALDFISGPEKEEALVQIATGGL